MDITECTYTNLDIGVSRSTGPLNAVKRHGKHKMQDTVASSACCFKLLKKISVILSYAFVIGGEQVCYRVRRTLCFWLER